MTEKCVLDRKDHKKDEHERWNLTENVLQRRTLTGEFDRNQIIKTIPLRRLTYLCIFRSYSTIQVRRHNDFKALKILVIFMGISVMFNRSC